MGTRRVGGFVALAALGAVLASLSVVPAARAQAPAAPLRVSMYGDSVLLGAKEELLAAFSDQQATVDAAEDRSLLGATSILQAAGPALGDVVVLDFGYNDSSDPTVFRGRIDAAMAAMAGVRHVIWVNQHDWGPGRADMNAELAAAQSRYPNLDVVDWNTEVAAHPDYVYADQIHLTPAGQPAFAALVRQHFDAWIRSLTPTTTSPSTTAPSTTGAPHAARSSTQRAAAASDPGDDPAFGRREVLVVVIVVVVLAAGAAVIVGRRGSRRARRGARRGR